MATPPIAATARAGAFTGAGVVAAHGATGRITPAAANVQRFNSNAARPQAGNGMALHSANFAPHANTANVAHSSGSTYRPTSVNHANYTAHTSQTNTHRPASTGYHPAAAPAVSRAVLSAGWQCTTQWWRTARRRRWSSVARPRLASRLTSTSRVATKKARCKAGLFLCMFSKTDLSAPQN